MNPCVSRKKEIKEIIPKADYDKGCAYYTQGRVVSYREEDTEDAVKISCKVQGTQLYTVNASYSARGLAAHCTCRRFADTHCCKHLAAALLALNASQKMEIRATTGWRKCSRPI